MNEKEIAQRLLKMAKDIIGTSHEKEFKEIKQQINSVLDSAEELYEKIEDSDLSGGARLRGVISKLNEARRIISQ